MKTIFVAGEHCDYEAKAWAEKVFQVPILNHWWQTETGHAITATCLGLGHTTSPPKYSTGMPFPGYYGSYYLHPLLPLIYLIQNFIASNTLRYGITRLIKFSSYAKFLNHSYSAYSRKRKKSYFQPENFLL